MTGSSQQAYEILEIKLLNKDPMKMFALWLEDAKRQPELNLLPETMTLSTVREDGGPSSRSVLLRGLDDQGFKMYWDKRSRKTNEIKVDARGSLVFVWHFKEHDKVYLRQVRIEGLLEVLEESENISYFQNEPITSKIRAIVCHQSQVVTPESREQLFKRTNELWESIRDEPENMRGSTLSKPDHFGGYRLVPQMIEFYLGEKDAINDRIRFRKTVKVFSTGSHLGENGWVYERLEP